MRSRGLSSTHTTTAEPSHRVVEACEQGLTASLQLALPLSLVPFPGRDISILPSCRPWRWERGMASRAGLFTQFTGGSVCPKRSSTGQEIVCMQQNQANTNYFMNKGRY